MSQPVHDATGTVCGVCKKQVLKSSMNLTIPSRNKLSKTIEHKRVCGSCYHKNYEKGD